MTSPYVSDLACGATLGLRWSVMRHTTIRGVGTWASHEGKNENVNQHYAIPPGNTVVAGRCARNPRISADLPS